MVMLGGGRRLFTVCRRIEAEVSGKLWLLSLGGVGVVTMGWLLVRVFDGSEGEVNQSGGGVSVEVEEVDCADVVAC